MGNGFPILSRYEYAVNATVQSGPEGFDITPGAAAAVQPFPPRSDPQSGISVPVH